MLGPATVARFYDMRFSVPEVEDWARLVRAGVTPDLATMVVRGRRITSRILTN